MSTGKNMYEEIARVAYGLYEKRGRANGNDFGDWVEAEKIVMKKYSKGIGSEIQNSKTQQKMKATEKTKSKTARVTI